jgi:hypothetical protein
MMVAGGRGGKPGVLLFRGWSLESRFGAEAKAQLATIKNDIEEWNKKLEPKYPYLHGVEHNKTIVNLPVSIRGNPANLGPEAPRHFLSMLAKDDPKPYVHGSGRLELADDIVKQPIAIRVIVNRIWKGHFGTGIVDTPSNFGQTGERPTNPEPLEYLAFDFVKNGMSVKKLHRQIMLSQVYQLSTEMDNANFAKDSGNRLYWRADKKRMDAEQVRDSVMLVAGNLDRTLGGPSEALKPSFTRRTVYGRVSRYKLDEYLQLFDFPSPSISAEKRFVTAVPRWSHESRCCRRSSSRRASPRSSTRRKLRAKFRIRNAVEGIKTAHDWGRRIRKAGERIRRNGGEVAATTSFPLDSYGTPSNRAADAISDRHIRLPFEGILGIFIFRLGCEVGGDGTAEWNGGVFYCVVVGRAALVYQTEHGAERIGHVSSGGQSHSGTIAGLQIRGHIRIDVRSQAEQHIAAEAVAGNVAGAFTVVADES